MVNVSFENMEETKKRLLQVIAKSELKIFPGTYFFEEFTAEKFQKKFRDDALAIVRDGDSWSQLIAGSNNEELFGIFSFHFPYDMDNSGFVGWLASHLKQQFGSGVFVICGQNSAKGGIFDYWGVPAALKDNIIDEIMKIQKK